jgi:hypothetical protein
MDDEMSILNAMVPQLEKMCIMDDDEVAYMEAITTSIPTSHERDYKGMDIGVDDDAMIPLVDMMTCECLHNIDDPHAMSYASFIFPCDALLERACAITL